MPELVPVGQSQPLGDEPNLETKEESSAEIISTSIPSDSEASQQEAESVVSLVGNRCCSIPDHLQPVLVRRDGKLFGREEESAKLNDAYERRTRSNVQELILLTGKSGSGKTSLVRTLKPRVAEDGGQFISGKFDQLRSPEPFAPFVAAFTELASMLSSDDVGQLKMNMDTDIDQQLMLQMIPALDVVLDEGSTTDSSKISDEPPPVQHVAMLSDNLRRRFLVALTRFLRVVSAAKISVTFFLDDLQWADLGSLELIHMIAESRHLPGLVLIGACRDSEVAAKDDLSVMLRSLEKLGICITEVCVQNFSEEEVVSFTASILERTNEDCRVLGAMMYRQSEGNPMFFVQYMRNLFEFGAFPHDGNRYNWDQDELHEVVGEKNPVELVAIDLTRIPADRLHVLKVASCLGARFDERLLQLVIPAGVLADNVNALVADGSFIRERGQLCFSRDQLQAAAYTVIPESERSAFHLKLAKDMKNGMHESKLKAYLFVVASQVVRGTVEIDTHEDRQEMALLCLQAAQKASKLASFEIAGAYIDSGIEILGSQAFSHSYSLALALYNAGAEVAYCNAKIDEMQERIEQVLRNARNLDDQLQAYFTQMMALGSRNQIQEAIDTGFNVLRLLGEPVPSRMGLRHTVFAIAKTKWMMRGETASTILSLPRMTDMHKLAAMRVFDLLFLYVFFGRPEFLPFIACRHVQLSLRDGLNAMSATGFGGYAVLLCAGGVGSIREGYDFAALALEIFHVVSAGRKEWLPRVFSSVYGMTAFWREPMVTTLQPLLESYHVGQKTGDFEFASLSAFLYCVGSFFCGVPLGQLKEEAVGFFEMMVSYNQHTVLSLLRSYLQMMANLCGESDDPLSLTGQYCDYKAHKQMLEESGNKPAKRTMELSRLYICSHTGDFEATLRIRRSMKDGERHSRLIFTKLNATLQECLAICALHRTGYQPKQRSKRLRQARQGIRMMQAFAREAPHNFLGRATFLEAEMAAVKRNIDGAVVLYKLAITLAQREGFIQQEALYNERMAVALYHCMREKESTKCLIRARGLYVQWGSVLAVDRIDRMLQTGERI